MIKTLRAVLFLTLFCSFSASAAYFKGASSAKEYYASQVEAQLRQMPNRYAHVRYNFGSSSSRYMDCSSFIMRVARDVFDVQIPRTTLGQVGVGERISRSELQPGDLILFFTNSSRSRRHVGMYVGNDEFLHISSGRSRVVIVSLSRFINGRSTSFWQARRIANVVPDNGIYSTPDLIPEPQDELLSPEWY